MMDRVGLHFLLTVMLSLQEPLHLAAPGSVHLFRSGRCGTTTHHLLPLEG